MFDQYFSLVVFLFVLEFLLAAAGFLLRVPLGSYLQDELRLGIQQHYSLEPPSSLATLWDHTQNNVIIQNKHKYDKKLKSIQIVRMLRNQEPRRLVRHKRLAWTKLCARFMLYAQILQHHQWVILFPILTPFTSPFLSWFHRLRKIWGPRHVVF